MREATRSLKAGADEAREEVALYLLMNMVHNPAEERELLSRLQALEI
jgi:hypothetical protein